MIAVCFRQSVSQLLRCRSGARRVLVTHQQQGERDEGRVAVIAAMPNFFLVKSAIVLRLSVAQSVVMRMISLNQNLPGQIASAGASRNLSDELKGSLGSAE